jgi:uncharacterized membrane protein YbhN (UPF0104 family)
MSGPASILKAYALRPARYLASLGGSALVIWLLLRSMNLGLMGHILAHAHLIYLLPISGAFLLRYLLRALRWQRLVRHIRHISVMHSFDRVIICQAADRVLPAQLAYPATVQIAAAKFDIRHFQLFGTDLVEKLMDAVVYALFLALALATLRIGATFTGIAAFLIGGSAVALGLIWWLTRRPAHRRVPAHWPFARFLAQFLEGVESIQDKKRTLHIFLVSLAIWGIEVTLYLMVALALGIHLNPLLYFFLVAAANTGAAVPLAQAAVGFIFVAQQVLVHAGHTAAIAATYAVTLEALLILSVLLLAPPCAYRLRLTFSDLLPHRQAARPATVTA